MIWIDMEMPNVCAACRFYYPNMESDMCLAASAVYGRLIRMDTLTGKPDWCPLLNTTWISVKDRPPEAQSLDDDNWVLVWFGEGSELKTKMPLVGRYDAIYGTWTVQGVSENTQSRLTISHWMPLPKPPKEG